MSDLDIEEYCRLNKEQDLSISDMSSKIVFSREREDQHMEVTQ